MGQRLDLHALLLVILGTEHVYFQPPQNVQMQYPCIVYRRDKADTKFADNSPYRYTQRYQVTIIDKSPDSVILPKIAALPLSMFNRFYTVNNLNHDVFELYY
jgi:hypothetical protein